jgi:hypothetical protein
MTKARDLSQVPNASLGFKNRIINGAMQVWQRGTSFAAIGTGVYSTDRWKTTIAGTSVSVTATQDTSVPSLAFKYSLKYQQITANATSVTEYATRQGFELANVQDLAGQAVTVSFWYRSNVVGTHGVRILPLGTTGGADTSVAFTVNSANTWEYKTITTTALSAITSWGSTADNAQALIVDIGLRVKDVGQTTVNVNDNFQITGVQLEKGSTATSWDTRSYGTELALCQRYYYRQSSGTSQFYGMAQCVSTTAANGIVQFPTSMRVTPSALEQSGTASDYKVNNSGADVTCNSVPVHQIATFTNGYVSFPVASGLTVGRAAGLQSAGTNSFLAWSAEL